MALLHESSVLNIHSAVISPCDCNDYYWTIVIVVLMSDRPGKAMITIGQ
ncbi:MAG: hypothetical protein SWX82_14360 [Cyanobacteriota bacterium]|nr:hypothetical protein [Cyanobacteriota bacterium]